MYSVADHRVLEADTVLEAVAAALTDLVRRDRVLLSLQAHELALVHRFGVYLESRLGREITRLALSVDLDYDRHGDMPKLLPPRPDREGQSRFRPDLIVHRRLDDVCNLLVVEWKKNADELILQCLEERVRSLLTRDGYRYQIGVIIDSSHNGARWRCVDNVSSVGDWRQIVAS